MSDDAQPIDSPPRRPSRFSGWAAALLLLLCILGGAYGGYHYPSQPVETPLYESMSVILVPLELPNDPRATNISQGSKAHIVKSLLIAERAVEKHRLQELATFQGRTPTEIASDIVGGLRVKHVDADLNPQSPLIEIRYRSTNGQDAETVVRAVVAEFEKFWDETEQSVFGDTARLLSDAKDELAVELKKNRDDLVRFTKEAPSGTLDADGQEKRSEKELRYLADFQTQHRLKQDQVKNTEQLYQLVLSKFEQIDLVSTARHRAINLHPADAHYPVDPEPRAFPTIPVGFGATLGLIAGLALLALRSAVFAGH